jgi:hypothetical protein
LQHARRLRELDAAVLDDLQVIASERAMNWSPMSMKAIPGTRPRSSSSKIRP